MLSSDLKDTENKRELGKSIVYRFLLIKLLYIGLWYFTWFITLYIFYFLFIFKLVLVFCFFWSRWRIFIRQCNLISFLSFTCCFHALIPALSGPKDPSKWTHSHAQKNFNPAQNTVTHFCQLRKHERPLCLSGKISVSFHLLIKIKHIFRSCSENFDGVYSAAFRGRSSKSQSEWIPIVCSNPNDSENKSCGFRFGSPGIGSP